MKENPLDIKNRKAEYNFKFDRPKHEYTDRTTKEVIPSVTQVGGELKDIPFLSSKIGDKRYEFKMTEGGSILNASVLDTASERGTRIHGGIEEYVKSKMGQKHDLDNVLKGFTKEERGSYDKAIGALERYEQKNKIEYLGTELKLGGKTAHGRIAGTTDIIARLGGGKDQPGVIHIIDFKSTSDLPSSIGEQTAVYRHMLKQSYGIDEEVRRAALWSSVDEKKEAYFITEKDKGAHRIFKPGEEDFESWQRKHGDYVKRGHAPRASLQEVRENIKEKLAWQSKEGQGSMYFGTFRDWNKRTVFSLSDFKSTLDTDRKEDTAWNLYESVADELGLEFKAGLTSKKGKGVNLYVNPKKGMTASQQEEVNNLRAQASKKIISESGKGILDEFFFLKKANPRPLIGELGASISSSLGKGLGPAVGLGAVVGAGLGIASAYIGRDKNLTSTYKEDDNIGVKAIVGAAAGALAVPAIRAVMSNSGPMMGSVGQHRLSKYALDCFKGLRDTVVRTVR